MELLADDGHQHVNGNSDPDLRFDRVLGSAIEGFDSKMLFDPFEEQLDLPPGLVQQGDGQSRHAEVVRQEHEFLARRRIGVPDAAQSVGITATRVKTFQSNRLIEMQAQALLDRMGIASTELRIGFGSGDEESTVAMNTMKPGKIQIAPVHDVEGSRFEGQIVEDVDVVNLAGGNNDKGRNASLQIQQGMQFDRSFVLSELGPREQGQAEIDRRGIQSEGGLLQFDAEIFVHIQNGGLLDQDMGEIGEDTPVSSFVGIGQSASGSQTVHSRMIELGPQGPQTRFDVAQALPVGELGERHHQELLVTGQRFCVSIALVPPHALVEFVPRQPVHHLGKDDPAFVHNRVPPERIRKKYHTKAEYR